MRLFQKSGSEKMENSKIVDGIRHKNIPWFVWKGADALHNVDSMMDVNQLLLQLEMLAI